MTLIQEDGILELTNFYNHVTWKITPEDVRTFLATERPLDWQDTMSGNLLAQTVAWKYDLNEEVRVWKCLPFPSQRSVYTHIIPEEGWARQLLDELIEIENEHLHTNNSKIQREHLIGNLPSIGY